MGDGYHQQSVEYAQRRAIDNQQLHTVEQSSLVTFYGVYVNWDSFFVLSHSNAN